MRRGQRTFLSEYYEDGHTCFNVAWVTLSGAPVELNLWCFFKSVYILKCAVTVGNGRDVLGCTCQVDGECWFDSRETWSQLHDVADARLSPDAFHHSADVSFHFGEQKDGDRRPGSVPSLVTPCN